MTCRTKMLDDTLIDFSRRVLTCTRLPLALKASEDSFVGHTLGSGMGVVYHHGCVLKGFSWDHILSDQQPPALVDAVRGRLVRNTELDSEIPSRCVLWNVILLPAQTLLSRWVVAR
jgi:hypothetical protein